MSAGDNFSLNLGDTSNIILDGSFIGNQGDVNITWSSPTKDILSCTNCLNPNLDMTKLFNSTSVKIRAVDSVGCVSEDIVAITLNKHRGILVPTGFTPNDDSQNDVLYVYGKNNTIINIFRVFDRWGELVFEAKGFKVNEDKIGWDGKFRGLYAPSGVYVWYLEAQYIDGFKEVLKGSTTLIR